MKKQPFQIQYRWSEITQTMRPFLVPMSAEAKNAVSALHAVAGDLAHPLGGLATKVEIHGEEWPVVRLYHAAHPEGDWLIQCDLVCDSILGYFRTPKAKFPLGTVVTTEAAQGLGIDFTPYVERFAKGDWGDVCEQDSAANDVDMIEDGQLLGVYTMRNMTKILIISDPGRKTTTILLPEDY